MNPQIEAKLARLSNRRTLYELLAVKGDEKILAGYTRKGRYGILSMLRKNSDAWTKLTGDDSVTWGKTASDGATMGDWKISFSNRTQREAIIGGEHIFITEYLNQTAS